MNLSFPAQVAGVANALDGAALAAAGAAERAARGALERGDGGRGLTATAADGDEPRVSGRGPNRFEVELPALDAAAARARVTSSTRIQRARMRPFRHPLFSRASRSQ